MKKILSALTLSLLATTAFADDHTVIIEEDGVDSVMNSPDLSAQQAQGVVTFFGKVTQPTCTIAPGSLQKTVDLGEVSASKLQGQGLTANRMPFELELKNCPANYRAYEVGQNKEITFGEPKSKVAIQFDGAGKANVDQAGGYLKNTISWERDGGAKDVAVQVLNQAGGVINLVNNKNNTAVGALSKGKNSHTFNFQAQFLSVADAASAVTAGNFRSSIPFSITYK